MKPAAAFASALLLVGCGTLNPFSADNALPCPAVRLIDEASVFPRFRDGAAPTPENVNMEARIIGVEAQCDYDDGDKPTSGMNLNLTLLMGAERENDAADNQPMPFFVAALGTDGEVANKQTFLAEITFDTPDSRFAQGAPQEISLRFPADAEIRPWEYEVVIGFQLDRQQLGYRRSLQP